MSHTSGATRRLWDTKAPPTSALRDYGLASQARETDGDGLRLVAYASESAPIFTPEFPKADPYQFLELVCIEVIVPLKLDVNQKKGAWPSRPCGHWSPFLAACPSESRSTPTHTQAVPTDQRDALCPSAEIQKLKAIGIIREDLRGVLMTKNEQFLTSNEKTARSLFVYHINQMRLCPACSILWSAGGSVPHSHMFFR